jgi:hypothetical protein
MSDALWPFGDALAPDGARADAAALRAALDGHVLRKRKLQRNLLIATWNLKEFCSLTAAWQGG